MVWFLAALIWGFSEATLFFIVPDVLLTLAVVRLGVGRALLLSLAVLAGALAGGALMHDWGSFDSDDAVAVLDRIPAISMDMIERVQAKAQGMASMIHGSLTGVPYKVFAVAAGMEGVPRGQFLTDSVVARMLRWLLLIGLTAAIVAALRRAGREKRALPLWAVLWAAFYALYFLHMPG